MVYAGIAFLDKTNQEQIYGALIELQGRTLPVSGDAKLS